MKKVPYMSKWETGKNYTMLVYLDFINERIRIDDYRGNLLAITKRVKELAKQYCFSKEIIKSRKEDWHTFLTFGYECEGLINGFFNGSDLVFMTHYHLSTRRTTSKWKEEDDLLAVVLEKTPKISDSILPDRYQLKLANDNDSENLATLYSKVFQGYPTPMDDPAYIGKVMKDNTVFYVVEWNGEIVSAASAEICENYHNGEITDCATLPAHRKYGFMQLLILKLEEELIQRKIYCSYSLARAQSFGMNAVLKQLNYQYSGRLTNNCMMNGNFEDMNVWVKKLV